jgi:hypothetical protein
MVFMHVNFVRGEKKRCLVMRSVAKKTPAMKDFPFGLAGRMPASVNAPQEFGLNFPQHGMDPMGGALSMTNGYGLGDSSSLAMNNRFPQLGQLGITSADVFEAGLRLQKMERERQRQLMIMSMMTNGLGSSSATTFNPPPNMGLNNNFGMSNFGNMSDMHLASELMKRNPNMR